MIGVREYEANALTSRLSVKMFLTIVKKCWKENVLTNIRNRYYIENLSDNSYVDLSDNHIDLSVKHVELADNYVDFSEKSVFIF